MTAPATGDEFLTLARLGGLVPEPPPGPPAETAEEAADRLVRAGLLRPFVANSLLAGAYRGYVVGPFRILDHLGTGGMARVYLARHTLLDRLVALKFLAPALQGDPSYAERFLREARAAASLDHPNIVRCHDVCREGNDLFIVLEYLEGRSLDRVLAARGPMPVGAAVDCAIQAAAGLGHAHERGLIHRDVKPGNLLLDASGVVKVLDLGIAKRVSGPAIEASLTGVLSAGEALGTADFLAPEQAAGLGDVDGRADIYSLGATLYALLAGRPPFDDATVTLKIAAHLTRPAEPLTAVRPGVPPGVAAVVARMMAKRPGDRYADMAEVAAVLAPFAGPGPDTRDLLDIPPDPRQGTPDAYRSDPDPATKARTVRLSAAALTGDGSGRSAASTGRPPAAATGRAPTARRRSPGVPARAAAAVALLSAGAAGLWWYAGRPPAPPPVVPPVTPVAAAGPAAVEPGASAELPAPARALAVAPSGEILVVGDGGMALLFTPDTPAGPRPLSDTSGRLDDCRAAPGGRLVATGESGTWVWGPPPGREPAIGVGPAALCADLIPGGRDRLLGAADGTVTRYAGDWSAARQYAGLSGPVRSVLALAGGAGVAAAGDRVRVWDAGGAARGEVPLPGPAAALALAPGGEILAGGGRAGEGFVLLIDPERLDAAQRFGDIRPLGGVTRVAVDATRAAAACEDGDALVWDRATGRLLARFAAHAGTPATGVGLLPEGRLVTCGGRRASLWRVPVRPPADAPAAPPLVSAAVLARAAPTRLSLHGPSASVGAGDGLPEGWTAVAWHGETAGSVSVAGEPGDRRLELAADAGPFPPILVLQTPAGSAGHRYALSGRYRADRPLRVLAFQPDGGSFEVAPLPATGDAWKPLRAGLLLGAAGRFRFEFIPDGAGVSRVADVEVADRGAFPRVPGLPLADLRLADAAPARWLGTRDGPTEASGDLPEAVGVNVFLPGRAAEFAVADAAGSRALVARVLDAGPACAEAVLFGSGPAVPLRAGKTYRVAVEYLCPESEVQVFLRDGIDPGVPRQATLRCPATPAGWGRAEGVWVAPGTGRLTAYFAVPTAGTLAIRRVWVTEEAD